MEDSRMENMLRRLILKHKVRCRKISVDSDLICLGIESTKSTSINLVKDITKNLKLKPHNIIYGKWVFKRTSL